MRVRQKIFQSASYLAHWLQAMNEHALHPPFIFNLYTEAIKQDNHHPVFKRIEGAREKLLQNYQFIEISDLGAGSSITTAKKRRISKIARSSLTKASFSRLLYRLIRHMNSKNILELGTSLGINSLYLSAAAPEGTVFTLEGCPQTAGIAQKVFSDWEISNIKLQNGNIDSILPELLQKQLPQVDAAYLDANHTYAASMQYFNLLLPHLHDHSFLVLDDIYWSAEMTKAWKEICLHPRVSLSIDLYDAGILFFRPGIPKAHYILEF